MTYLHLGNAFDNYNNLYNFLSKCRSKQARITHGVYVRLKPDGTVDVAYYSDRHKKAHEWKINSKFMTIDPSGIRLEEQQWACGKLHGYLDLRFGNIKTPDTRANTITYKGKTYILGAHARNTFLYWGGGVIIQRPTVQERRIDKRARDEFYKNLRYLRDRVRVVAKLDGVDKLLGPSSYGIHSMPKLYSSLVREFGKELPDIPKLRDNINEALGNSYGRNGPMLSLADVLDTCIARYRPQLLTHAAAHKWVTVDIASSDAEVYMKDLAARQAKELAATTE